jgi:hypothetical protein
MMTEYMTHIPRVGRHGYLLEAKEDNMYCLYLRDMYSRSTTQKPDGWEMTRMVDDNDMCGCDPRMKGARWSDIMSHEVNEDSVRAYLGSGMHEECQEEMRELSEEIRYEEMMRRRFMSEDVSLASGESYR